MDAVTVRFDEVSRVRQEGGWGYRNYWPRQTVFSFMSDGKFFPYVATPGWPEIHDGLTVTALLEVAGNWRSLLGWVNRETGEIAGPSPVEFFKQAAVSVGWLVLGVVVTVAGIQKASTMAMVGVLFSGFCAIAAYLAFRNGRKARATLQALERLAENARQPTP